MVRRRIPRQERPVRAAKPLEQTHHSLGKIRMTMPTFVANTDVLSDDHRVTVGLALAELVLRHVPSGSYSNVDSGLQELWQLWRDSVPDPDELFHTIMRDTSSGHLMSGLHFSGGSSDHSVLSHALWNLAVALGFQMFDYDSMAQVYDDHDPVWGCIKYLDGKGYDEGALINMVNSLDLQTCHRVDVQAAAAAVPLP